MKKNKPFRELFFRSLKKTLLIMRIAIILMIFGILQAHANDAYSQKTRLSLNFSNTALINVLDKIETESEFFFLYNEKLLDTDRKINITTNNELIDVILDNLFAGTDVKYTIINRKIVLAPEYLSNKSGSTNLIQQKIVTGTVTDSQTGEVMPGVNILVKGSTIGTISDANGKYSLTIPDKNVVLVFSFIGYNALEIPVSGKSVLNAVLVPETQTLEEVVVIGYGTVKKSSVTASISKVENKILGQIPTSRIESALVGRLAGVNITNIRNNPGDAPIIRVRGAGSIDAGNDPLIVIDGFPGGDLSQVNMNDIQSIEVLKDASSAAIYGSRGAGGVILVTTKRGSAGAPKLSLNTYVGAQAPRVFDDWIMGQEFYDYLARYQNREYIWAGGDPSIPMWDDPRRPSIYRLNPVVLREPQAIYQDLFTQTGLVQSHNLAVNGGTERVKYYVSGTYNNENGTIKNMWYKSYFLRTNVDIKINDIMSMGVMYNPSYTKQRTKSQIMGNLSKYPPYVPVYKEDGSYAKVTDFMPVGSTSMANPFEYINDQFYYNTSFNNFGETFISFDLLEGLQLKTSLGGNINNYTQDRFSLINEVTSGSKISRSNINLINENTLNYNKTFNEIHGFNGLLGASYQKSNAENINIYAVNNSYNNSIIHTLNNALINPSNTNTTNTEWGLISYFARINYEYDQKYLISTSLRADGCSRFGSDNKWGYFPSASVAWRVSRENFMQSIPIISELKVRGSFGTTGNFNIGDFDYLGRITSTNYSPNNILVKGMTQSTFENRKLGWEKTISYDLGLEFGLFKNRVNFVLDYYDKRTSGLLYNVTIPAYSGFTSSLFNIGEVANKGVELEINTKNLIGDINWQTSFTLAHNKNEVIDLGGVTERVNTISQGMSWILKVGEPMFSFYGYRMIGVLQDEEEIASTPVLAGSKPGFPKMEDVNRDGVINPEDRVILGTFMPKVQLGMINDFSWKKFDLSITMQASLGAKTWNYENMYYLGSSLCAMRRSLVENQWWSPQEPGDGKTPAIAQSYVSYVGSTDWFIEDCSYFFVRNLNFGYTLRNTISNKIGMSNLRIYTSMHNILMIKDKNNHMYNPEGYTNGEISGTSSTPGRNNGTEPINMTVTFGANITF